MEALAKIQQKLKAPKSQFNKFGNFHYRSCEDILEAVKPLLGNCTITISDEVKETLGIPYIEATAVFTDGTTYSSVKAQAGINPNTKGMSIAQCFGASSSYARKYALAGLLLLDDAKDSDAKEEPEETEPLSEEEINTLKDKLETAHAKGMLNSEWKATAYNARPYLRDFVKELVHGKSESTS